MKIILSEAPKLSFKQKMFSPAHMDLWKRYSGKGLYAKSDFVLKRNVSAMHKALLGDIAKKEKYCFNNAGLSLHA